MTISSHILLFCFYTCRVILIFSVPNLSAVNKLLVPKIMDPSEITLWLLACLLLSVLTSERCQLESLILSPYNPWSSVPFPYMQHSTDITNVDIAHLFNISSHDLLHAQPTLGFLNLLSISLQPIQKRIWKYYQLTFHFHSKTQHSNYDDVWGTQLMVRNADHPLPQYQPNSISQQFFISHILNWNHFALNCDHNKISKGDPSTKVFLPLRGKISQ